MKPVDFDDPSNNTFTAVSQMWIQGVILLAQARFVNGLPMAFIELRNSIPSQAGKYFPETLKHLLDRAKLESTELFITLVDKMIARDGLTQYCGIELN